MGKLVFLADVIASRQLRQLDLVGSCPSFSTLPGFQGYESTAAILLQTQRAVLSWVVFAQTTAWRTALSGMFPYSRSSSIPSQPVISVG